MKIYSHRGNLSGKDSQENEPAFIKQCLAGGFHVEIDLWFIDNKYFLGHDEPTYRIDIDEFDHEEVIFHLKTPHLPLLRRADAFAIENDPYVLTLRGLLWMNYGQTPGVRSVMCSPELVGHSLGVEAFVRTIAGRAAGLCTDYPLRAAEALARLAAE